MLDIRINSKSEINIKPITDLAGVMRAATIIANADEDNIVLASMRLNTAAGDLAATVVAGPDKVVIEHAHQEVAEVILRAIAVGQKMGMSGLDLANALSEVTSQVIDEAHERVVGDLMARIGASTTPDNAAPMTVILDEAAGCDGNCDTCEQ